MAMSGGCFLLFALLLCHRVLCSSGALVERGRWSPTEASSYHFKLLVAEPEASMDSLTSSSDVPIHLCLNQFQANELLESRAQAISWLKSHLISSILVNSTVKDLPFLLPTLKSIKNYLRTLNVDRSVNVSPMFSLSMLENLDTKRYESIRRVVGLVRNSSSYVVVEVLVDGQTGLGDDFVRSTVRRALSASAALPYLDVPIVLHVKSSASPGEVEIAHFIDRVMQVIRGHALLANRISGLFLDVAHLGEASSHRVLLGHGRRWIKPVHVSIHDTFPPITYPVNTPITVPDTNPPPAMVTVPSTNPVTFIPMNPTMAPITVTPTSPVTTPISTPATNTLPAPVTTPVVAVTNPAATPITFPTYPPANPVTTYPTTPTWNSPSIAPPGTLPGQAWCVAKAGVSDASLQNALDYSCGIGGVDCSVLQPMGSCYNPNTLQAHASYAFNSYYQRNPVVTSCDFGGTAMLVNANPSSGTCIYASSSSVPNYNPVTTGSTPVSGSTPSTNPVTIYPTTPTWNSPSIAPPVTVPSTFPVTPAVTPALPGQTWCVARAGVIDAALKNALDYSCGIGGVDCSALQPMGSCYNPNTLQAHASYAFNSYYQKNPMATSCDFGGTAMLVNANPSSGTCIYPSSSSTPNYNPVSTYNPATTTTGTTPVSGSTPASGSSVFNTNSGGTSPSVYGSSSPTGALSGSLSLSAAGWTSLVFLLTAVCISINININM